MAEMCGKGLGSLDAGFVLVYVGEISSGKNLEEMTLVSDAIYVGEECFVVVVVDEQVY